MGNFLSNDQIKQLRQKAIAMRQAGFGKSRACAIIQHKFDIFEKWFHTEDLNLSFQFDSLLLMTC
jgi:hypothetical protein